MLEIGCGIGRLVYELAPFLDRGRYAGFDISSEAIGWLNEHYAPRLPNFRFDVVDVYNARYNRESEGSAETVRWPYDDDTFDFACAFSVFTHMRLPEVEHYLAELRRVLRPGGRAVVTFALITNRDRPPYVHARKPLVALDDVSYTRRLDRPERGLAYHEAAVRAAIGRSGLTIVEIIDGAWHGWDSSKPRVLNDAVVVTA
jgi:SAM-dependent methyltransferase